jgi:hypothetical protein
MFHDQRHVRLDDTVHSIRGKFQDILCRSIVQVIEKNPAQPTSLPSVLDEEIIVAPRFEFGIEIGIVSIADLFVRAVEVLHVFGVEIGRRDICAPTKPPAKRQPVFISNVGVSGIRTKDSQTNKQRK